MSNNPQVGGPLRVQGPPVFANYVVVQDTWDGGDLLQVSANRDGNGNMYNYTGWSPGDAATCDWWIKPTGAPAKTLNVITESLLVLFTGQPAAASTLIIGGVTYHFVAALTGGADEVLIGGNINATLANLAGALNLTGTGGQAAGTTYGVGTVANPACTASVNLSDGYGVQLDQVTPWTSANALSISGTCAAAVVGAFQGQQVSTLAAPIVARSFVVPKTPKTKYLGGKPQKQSMELNYHADGFVPTVQS